MSSTPNPKSREPTLFVCWLVLVHYILSYATYLEAISCNRKVSRCLTVMTKCTFYSNYTFRVSHRFSHLRNWENLHLNLSLMSTLNHVFEPRERKVSVKLQRRVDAFLLCDCFYRSRSCEDYLQKTPQRRVSKSLTSDSWEKDQCEMSCNCYTNYLVATLPGHNVQPNVQYV